MLVCVCIPQVTQHHLIWWMPTVLKKQNAYPTLLQTPSHLRACKNTLPWLHEIATSLWHSLIETLPHGIFDLCCTIPHTQVTLDKNVYQMKKCKLLSGDCQTYPTDFSLRVTCHHGKEWIREKESCTDKLTCASTEQQISLLPLWLCALLCFTCDLCLPHWLIDPTSSSFFLSLPQIWFSAQMRWMWTSLSWPTHCLRGPPTPAGWLCSSPSPQRTIWWSMAMRSELQCQLFLIFVWC